jgi:hypothetical protein
VNVRRIDVKRTTKNPRSTEHGARSIAPQETQPRRAEHRSARNAKLAEPRFAPRRSAWSDPQYPHQLRPDLVQASAVSLAFLVQNRRDLGRRFQARLHLLLNFDIHHFFQ